MEIQSKRLTSVATMQFLPCGQRGAARASSVRSGRLRRLGAVDEPQLAPALVGCDGRGVGEVQAASARQHWQAQVLGGRDSFQHTYGQSARFRPEQQRVIQRVVGVSVEVLDLAAERPDAGVGVVCGVVVKGFECLHAREFAVVEPGAPQAFLVEVKPHRLDQAQTVARVGRQPNQVTGVLGDFGFVQNDVWHGTVFSSSTGAARTCRCGLDSPYSARFWQWFGHPSDAAGIPTAVEMANMAISNDDQAFAPFALTLEPSVFFTGGGRGAVLEELFESVDSGAPVCLVTGANGAGKSALVAQLASRFEHMADVLYLPQPRLPVVELVHALSEQIGVDSRASTDGDLAEQQLTETLQRRRAQGRRTVLVVEEAQAASSATLRSLHRMCQSAGDDPWLQLLVFADSDAEETEALPRVLTPVSTHIELAPPTVEEVQAYCNQRLELAGWAESGLIDHAVAADLHALAKGSFRRLNLIAGTAVDHAMADGEQAVDSKRVRRAVRALGLGDAQPVSRPTVSVRDRISSLGLGSMRVVPPVRWAVPAACGVGAVVLLMSARGVLESDSISAVQTPAPRVAPVAALTQEPRMVQPTPAVTPVLAEPVATAPVVEAIENETVVSERPASPERTLGDPRVALLGSAIAGLAHRVSDAGNGAFALRTSAEPASVLRLVQQVDRSRFVLGPRGGQPVATVAAVAQQLPSNPADALDDWFLQSTNWLGQSTADSFSIQLLLVSRDTDKLREFLDQLPGNVDRASLRAFPTQRDGRELTLVVFGDYANADAARNAIANLPRSLRRLQPFVRSVDSLRNAVESV